jgi:DNA-directed RNA polymerase sigma subunit (sigma70/sigma32)
MNVKMPDLRQQVLEGLKGEYLDALDPEERAVIEASMGEMGNKPDAVKLGWLKIRTKEAWTKQRYTRTFNRALEKLRQMVESRGRESGEG